MNKIALWKVPVEMTGQLNKRSLLLMYLNYLQLGWILCLKRNRLCEIFTIKCKFKFRITYPLGQQLCLWCPVNKSKRFEENIAFTCIQFHNFMFCLNCTLGGNKCVKCNKYKKSNIHCFDFLPHSTETSWAWVQLFLPQSSWLHWEK